MSLNGLDDPRVKEAYDTAVAEPGGWFLLKYISRDEIELLGRGNGGIVEARNAIAGHDEPSPLFGFLRYRRRNVLLKYVPENCSRLVQARVSVHFSAVQERFAPIDTEFSMADSKDLKDSTLSAACSLHTASGSTSSSTSSLRRRRLMEIAEEEEEERKRQSTVVEERPPTVPDPMPELIPSSANTASTKPATSAEPAEPAEPVTTAPLPLVLSSIKSGNLETEPPPPRSPKRVSMDETKLTRKSTSSARPDLYSYGSSHRPKVKLGPRPSFDIAGNKRPHTSSAASQFRPVSTLPVGLKIFSSKSPRKTPPTAPPSMTIAPPPVPDTSESTPSRPHTSGGTARPPPVTPSVAVRPASIAPKTPTMTPEKARLMKALELRKKQMNSTPANVEEPSPSPGEGSTSPNGAPKDVQDTLTMLNDMAKENDSGVAFDARSMLKTDESDATRSDSYPVSPVALSERAESTTASSISESTDETVQETKRDATDEPQVETERAEEPATVITQEEQVPRENAGEHHQLLPTVYERPSTDIVRGEDMKIPQEAEQASPDVSPPLATEETQQLEGSIPSADLSKAEAPIVEQSEGNVEIAPVATEPAEEVPVESERASPKVPAELLTPRNANGSATPEEALPESVPPPVSPVKEDQIPRSRFAQPVITIPQQETKPELPAQKTPDSASPTKSVPREIRVPRSKFSLQNLKADNNPPEVTTEPMPSASINIPQKSPISSTFSVDSKRSFTEDDKENDGHSSQKKRKKRKGLVEPIRTDLDITDRSGHNTDDVNLSSDDELMDELDSAVVQEAKPISVSRSPIASTFPQKSSPGKRDSWRNRISRVSSNPISNHESVGFLGVPKRIEPTRSVSASVAFLNQANQEHGKPLAKKVNVGSGISQRIKALEKLSSSSGAADPTSLSSPSAPAFFSVKKGRGTSPSVVERANSLNRNTPTPDLRDTSRESSPEAFHIRERSESLKNRKTIFESPPNSRSSNAETIRPRVESVSVTARIVRDSAQQFPSSTVAKDEFPPLDLKQSPLVIDHKKSDPSPPPPKETIQERRQSKERRMSVSTEATTSTANKRRSSITIVKDLINEGRASFSERRRSGEFTKSASSPSVRSPRPPSTHSAFSSFKRSSSRSSRNSVELRSPDALSPPPTAHSGSSANEEKEKKGSRSSRLMRRMSNSISSSRKAISHAMSPTVREDIEPMPSPPRVPLASPIANLNIGDVNVQFPDSLLWKRRSMLIDASGYLILSAALAPTSVKGKAPGATTRKFHFGEFRAPTIPDADMQELPNSVVLEFVEAGAGGLQIACEDRQGQARILEALQDAHKHHSS